jgi:rod shape-determining protein MreD
MAWFAPLVGMLLWAPVFFLLDALRLRAWRKR